MSYNNRSDNFTVTANHDGARSFRGNGNVRFTHGSNYRGSKGRGYSGNRGSRRPTYRNFSAGSSRHRLSRNNEDEEGDISMAGDSSRGQSSSRSRYHRSNRGRLTRGRVRGNNSRSNNNSYNRPHVSGPDQWYKIMVPFGTCLTEKDLFALVAANIDGAFDPVKYSVEDKRAFFYIKGSNAAENLRVLSRRLNKPDGHKLVFHVTASNSPMGILALSDDIVEKLKLRMSDRYDPATQLLNLSSFHKDDILASQDIHLSLDRLDIMISVAKIVSDHIPELSGLDLRDNRLGRLGSMLRLVKAAPNVTSLNLGNNQICNKEDLGKLKGWSNLTELVLDGNNICTSFSSQATYVSVVRKIFPKLIRLDGQELPPPITFDLDVADLKVPPSKDSYFVNDDIRNLVVPFIKEYFTVYDSDRRRDLLAAYHENALMTVCTNRNPMFDKQVAFSTYVNGSRNIKKGSHIAPEKLANRVHVGNLRVVAQLESMPKTTHDIASFKVDVSVATPKLLSFVLHGVFQEHDGRSERLIRTFSRSFVTVPFGTGNSMVITNDMLLLSNAGYTQRQNAFKSGAPTPSPSPVPGTSTDVKPAVTSQTPAQTPSLTPSLTPQQEQMVVKFMADSSMNKGYSLSCLQGNSWDYQKAGQMFTELHGQGKIPPEAFVKEEL